MGMGIPEYKQIRSRSCGVWDYQERVQSQRAYSGTISKGYVRAPGLPGLTGGI